MLVVFDVDGTLTSTGGLDAEVYGRVFGEVFGAALPSQDWSTYASSTDRGVVEEAVRALRLDRRRIPDFQARFLAELGRALALAGAHPVPGAAEVLGRLEAAGHATALASGGWEGSARAKLAAAGIELGARVLVGSDFDGAREAIIREAARRCGAPGRLVYVGDGTWDVLAARALNIPFLGVDPGRTGALGCAGVRHVVEGYQEPVSLLSALAEATVP